MAPLSHQHEALPVVEAWALHFSSVFLVYIGPRASFRVLATFLG